MTLRLTPELDAAVKARAERDGVSQHKVVEAAVAAYTSDRSRRLEGIAHRIVIEDASLLARLAE